MIFKEMTHAEWIVEAKKRYGDFESVKFRCPMCGHVASVAEYQAAQAPEGMIGFSCIGRITTAHRKAFGGKGPGPCDYAGGGLFRVNPIHLTENGEPFCEVFDFADDPLCEVKDEDVL